MPTKRHAAWFHQIGKGLDLPTRARLRTAELLYLKDALKSVRQYVTGFGTKDGYSLRDISKLSAQRVKQLRTYGEYVNGLTVRPTKRVTPRSNAQREALAQFTGTDLPTRNKHHFKAWAVPVDNPGENKVEFYRDPDSGETKVQLVNTFTGGRLVERFYLFSDYGFAPQSWQEIIRATKAMIRKRGKKPAIMPDGWYTLWSAQQGTIFEPMQRDDIVSNLNYRFNHYDDKFASGILGYRFFHDEISAESESIARHQRSRERQYQKSERRSALRRRVTQHLSTKRKK